MVYLPSWALLLIFCVLWYVAALVLKRWYINHVVTLTAQRLRRHFEQHQVHASHGIGHAMAVLMNARKILNDYPGVMTTYQRLAVLLAALLHDADDRKFFTRAESSSTVPDKTTSGTGPRELMWKYQHAYTLMVGLSEDTKLLVLEMISIVSTAANGDRTSKLELREPFRMIPRWADRLEAIGEVGIVRCYEYTMHAGRPLYTPDTARAIRRNELMDEIATPQRYTAYKGVSASMVDHYYDKLLHLFSLPLPSWAKWLTTEAQRRHVVMVGLMLHFGRTGTITEADITTFSSRNRLVRVGA